MAKTSKTMLNNSGESGQPCLVPDLSGNGFSFSPLRTMLAVHRVTVRCECVHVCDVIGCALSQSEVCVCMCVCVCWYRLCIESQ